MAFSNTVITNSYGTITIKHDITETNLITFYLLNSTDRTTATRRVIDLSQSTINLTNDSDFDVDHLTVDVKYSDTYNNANYNGYLKYGSGNIDNPTNSLNYNSTYQEFSFVNGGTMLNNTVRTIRQDLLFNGVTNGVPIVYDFDSNVDKFYLTDFNGGVISENPVSLNANDYLQGYILTKNNATFDTVTIKKGTTNIGNSFNNERTRCNVNSEYIVGNEPQITFTATTIVAKNVDVTQNLTNCTSSINTLNLDLGSYTITLTANNDTIFNVKPVANYNNVDYTFTLNNDSTVATLEITLDVPDTTLTITGSASVASLQGISNFYKPTLEQLQYISNNRYKLLSGENSSERLDLGEYILNLKNVFVPLTTKTTEKVILGGNELDVYIHPLNKTYIDFTTPDIMIYGYYRNGFDIKNITSFYAMIPFYGIYELDREYINKNICFSFHIDLSNCNVEVGVYIDSKLTETLSGDCSIDIPYIMEKSLTPKTECFTEHLKIVVNEKTNCNNRIKTIKNDLISNFTGFIKGDVITDSIKATSNELDLLKQLFNEGVYNG